MHISKARKKTWKKRMLVDFVMQTNFVEAKRKQ